MIVCPLISGSSGNATYIESGATRLLVDCGATGAQIEKALRSIEVEPHSLTALLVTHSHDDHVRGLGILSRRYNLPIHASIGTWKDIMKRNKIGSIAPKNIAVFDTSKPQNLLKFGAITTRFFSTPHDADDSVGYVFSDGETSFGLSTDFGHVTPGIRAALLGCSVVLLESNYDPYMLEHGPYPKQLQERIAGAYGHLSNDDAGNFAVELVRSGTKYIYLGHLSEHNNTQELAYQTVARQLREAGVALQQDCDACDCAVYMTRRYEPSRKLVF